MKRCSSRMWVRSHSRPLGNLRATSASSRIFTTTVSGGDRACGLRQPGIDGCGGVSSTREDAGGIDSVDELARAGLGLANIVDDHIRPQLAVRELDAAHSMRDAAD